MKLLSIESEGGRCQRRIQRPRSPLLGTWKNRHRSVEQAPAGEVGPRTKSPRTTVSHTHVRMSLRVRTGVSRLFPGNGHLPLRFALEPSWWGAGAALNHLVDKPPEASSRKMQAGPFATGVDGRGSHRQGSGPFLPHVYHGALRRDG